MRLTANDIERWSTESGYRRQALELVSVVSDILGEISLDPFLEPRLALLGETAVQFAYAPGGRVPVRLEFHSLNETGPASSLDRAEITERLKLIGEEFGLSTKVGKERDEIGVQYEFECSDQSVAQFQARVHFNRFVALEPTIRMRPAFPGLKVAYEPLYLGRDEVVAELMADLLLKPTIAKMHDAVALAKAVGSEWASDSMKRAFVFFSGSAPRPLTSYTVERLGPITQRTVDLALNPWIPFGATPKASQLLEDAQAALAPFLILDKSMSEFVEALAQGHYDIHLLYGDRPTLANALTKDPGLTWKAVGAPRLASHAQPHPEQPAAPTVEQEPSASPSVN